MVITQNKQNGIPLKDSRFAINLLTGSVGKAVVETYFSYFGYETYPFGYENHYANVTRFIKRDPLKTTITKIRAMPDLLVFDREEQESFLVEMKACGNNYVSKYWIEKTKFETYKQYWPEAILTVYMISSGEIRCAQISEIEPKGTGNLPDSNIEGYFINLERFHELPHYFRRMNRLQCTELSIKIHKILCNFVDDSFFPPFQEADKKLFA